MSFPPQPGDAVRTAVFLQRQFGPIVDPTQIDEWPSQLQLLLEKYGRVKVWDAGFLALSYPATWCRSDVEARLIERWLIA